MLKSVIEIRRLLVFTNIRIIVFWNRLLRWHMFTFQLQNYALQHTVSSSFDSIDLPSFVIFSSDRNDEVLRLEEQGYKNNQNHTNSKHSWLIY